MENKKMKPPSSFDLSNLPHPGGPKKRRDAPRWRSQPRSNELVNFARTDVEPSASSRALRRWETDVGKKTKWHEGMGSWTLMRTC